MTDITATRSAAHRRRVQAAEIARTLARLGGAAHRDNVIDALLIARKREGRAVGKRIRGELISAFNAYCDLTPERSGDAVLFTLPFGRDSLRWSLAGTAVPSWARRAETPGRMSA